MEGENQSSLLLYYGGISQRQFEIYTPLLQTTVGGQ